MKLPAPNRTKFALAALLLLGSVLLALHSFNGGDRAIAASRTVPPAPPAAPSQPRQPRQTARRGRAASGAASLPVTSNLDPRLNLKLLQSSESIEYAGNGRNIFRIEADPVIPKPVAPAITPGSPSGPPTPPPPPPPPPIPLKFFGFANKPGEPTKAFLSQGEEVFVGAEGQIIDRRYRIVKINTTSIEVEDVLSNNHQTIPLTPGQQ